MPVQSTDRSIDYVPDDASGLEKLLKYLQLHQSLLEGTMGTHTNLDLLAGFGKF